MDPFPLWVGAIFFVTFVSVFTLFLGEGSRILLLTLETLPSPLGLVALGAFIGLMSVGISFILPVTRLGLTDTGVIIVTRVSRQAVRWEEWSARTKPFGPHFVLLEYQDPRRGKRTVILPDSLARAISADNRCPEPVRSAVQLHLQLDSHRD